MPNNSAGAAQAAPSLAQWQAQGQYFTFRGQRVFWQTAGDRQKPPLLLIHGFPSASWDWRHQWQSLAQEYYVIAADMPGFGFSDKSPHAEYSIAAQADMFEALLHSLNINRYHLVAHDYGDTVAQELLARQGDPGSAAILTVQLLNGGLFPETHRPVLVQKLLISPFGSLFARLFNEQKLRKTFSHICRQPLSDEELSGIWQLFRFNNGQRVMHKLIRYMQERREKRSRWVAALQQCSVPLQLINGAADPISGAHMVQRFHEVVGQRPLVSLADVGHYPQLEAAPAVTAALLAFLRKYS